jgi:outer membrane cobalamin receptor
VWEARSQRLRVRGAKGRWRLWQLPLSVGDNRAEGAAWTAGGAHARGVLIGAVTVALGALPGPPIWAQADSAPRPHLLEEQVVVAHRAPTMLRESVAATTVLDRSTLERLPARTLADALRYVPGLTFTTRDGAGELPMAIARGFFGGGETDYILLTVDGTPVNDLRTGIAEWTQIPLTSIERIEVLRGGASIAYGDAALGAVVNVVTRDALPSHRLIGELQLGSWGGRALQSSIQRSLGFDYLGVGVAAAGLDGFRSHAKATNVAVSASYTRRPGQRTSAYARVGVQRLRNQEPGPITSEQMARDPRQHNPLFASDERRRDLIELGTGLVRALGSGRLTGDVRVRAVDDEQTRTLPLSADAGDTQFQDARSWDLWARLQYSRNIARSTIVAGVEAERGAYDSRYTDPFDRAALRSRGEGERNKIGQYAELQQQIGRRLRAVAGVRFDLVTLDGTGTEVASPRFSQWSPRVGLNFAYADDASQAGNVYVAWTRSFKAPTAYQLYDVRLIPTGEPGVVFNLSNPALRPQHSSGVELGVYHRLAFWGGRAFAELTLSAYRLDVTDEIDFDLRTFKYGNILQSRHDGIEGSLTAKLSPSLSLRHALTLMRVTFRSGDDAGNRLKNIPETAVTSAVHVSFGDGVEGTVTHRFIGGLFLDDANRETLPGNHRIDATVSWALGAVRLHLTGVDLGDSHASSGGFLVYDPDRGASVRLLYPGAGRHLRAGVTVLR